MLRLHNFAHTHKKIKPFIALSISYIFKQNISDVCSIQTCTHARTRIHCSGDALTPVLGVNFHLVLYGLFFVCFAHPVFGASPFFCTRTQLLQKLRVFFVNHIIDSTQKCTFATPPIGKLIIHVDLKHTRAHTCCRNRCKFLNIDSLPHRLVVGLLIKAIQTL